MMNDRNDIVANKNIEALYIWELADQWININIKNKQEFEQKLNALGSILNDIDFKNAVEISKLALKEKDGDDNATKTAELIKKIKQGKLYIKNSQISGYQILSKYEEPTVYKTDSFIVHTNIMMRLYKYLQEKVNEAKKTESEE